MKKTVIILLISMFISGAIFAQEPESDIYPFSLDYDRERTVLRVFPNPPGFERFPSADMTRYMAWLTNFPLEADDHPVVRWDDQKLKESHEVAAVLDIGIASTNQRKEDLPLQLAMEYLRVIDKIDDFPFIIGKGDTVYFNKWLSGTYSRNAQGHWVFKEKEPKYKSEKEFYRFLEFIVYNNSIGSLKKNLEKTNQKIIVPGDIFIAVDENDSTKARVAVVVDVAMNPEGRMKMIVAQGGDAAMSFYMPKPDPEGDEMWFDYEEFRKQFDINGKGDFYRYSRLVNM